MPARSACGNPDSMGGEKNMKTKTHMPMWFHLLEPLHRLLAKIVHDAISFLEKFEEIRVQQNKENQEDELTKPNW